MAKTVLIVDDDPSILRAVEAFLVIKGHKVIATTDPREAFKIAQKSRPDLIISDIDMPDLDGFTLMKCVKENKSTQKIPFVLLTALNKIGAVDRGFEGGAQAYIIKPVEWDRAWAKIQPFLA